MKIRVINKIFVERSKSLGIVVILQRVSLIRPAPGQPPQVRKEARVTGCSGAI